MAIIESPIYPPNILPELQGRVIELSETLKSIPHSLLRALNHDFQSDGVKTKISFIPRPDWIKQAPPTLQDSYSRVYEQAWMEGQMLRDGKIFSLNEFRRFPNENIDSYVARFTNTLSQWDKAKLEKETDSTHKARLEGLRWSLSINMVSL